MSARRSRSMASPSRSSTPVAPRHLPPRLTQYQVFAFGVPPGTGEGSYTLTLQPAGGSPVVNVARAVTAPGGAAYAYDYDTTTVSGETYTLTLADFSFPAQFTSIGAAVVQNGALLGTGLNAAGTVNVNPVAGPVSLLVFAQPGTSGGLFGLSLAAVGAGASSSRPRRVSASCFLPASSPPPTVGATRRQSEIWVSRRHSAASP